jgi:hypothetical protein
MRPPRHRPVEAGPNTQLFELRTYDGPYAQYDELEPDWGTSPTSQGHHAQWALFHYPAPDNPFPFMWLCLTHTDHVELGADECGSWKTSYREDLAMAEAADHVAVHEAAARWEARRAPSRPPPTELNPTQDEVEAALRIAQADGPCPESALIESLMQAHRAAHAGPWPACITVSRRHLRTRLMQLGACGRLCLHQEQEWRGLTGVRWPSTSRNEVLYATREQGERWKNAPKKTRGETA